MADSAFDRILHYDPLLEAEKITGKSYKDDPATEGLGFLLLQESAQRKKDELLLRGDLYRSIGFTDAVDVARGMGFTPVWTHSGASEYGNPKITVVLWSDGILLIMDSYQGQLNSAVIHFNWRPFSGKSDEFGPIFSLPTGGGMEHRGTGFEDIEGDPWVYVGYIHVTEGLMHEVEKLRASGELLTEWYVTDDLLRVTVGEETKNDFSDPNWHDKVRAKIVARVAEFDEPARSAIQAGMKGKDWE